MVINFEQEEDEEEKRDDDEGGEDTMNTMSDETKAGKSEGERRKVIRWPTLQSTSSTKSQQLKSQLSLPPPSTTTTTATTTTTTTGRRETSSARRSTLRRAGRLASTSSNRSGAHESSSSQQQQQQPTGEQLEAAIIDEILGDIDLRNVGEVAAMALLKHRIQHRGSVTSADIPLMFRRNAAILRDLKTITMCHQYIKQASGGDQRSSSGSDCKRTSPGFNFGWRSLDSQESFVPK